MARPVRPRRFRKSQRPHGLPDKHERALIPGGMSTILPHAARRVRDLEANLLTTLRHWGYQEIILPTFEYLDVLSAGLEPDLLEKCYTLSDRSTGRILLLRPDVTAQIARIVAMGMVGKTLPLRLCYHTTVFRYEPEHAGREREIFQIGAELIGADSAATDAEVVALMIECLQGLGLAHFKISLGHVGFFKSLLTRTGMSLDGRKRAEHAAARKDLPNLEEILKSERVPPGQARAILEAPALYGREEVLERGRILAEEPRLRSALDRLDDVYRLLESLGFKDYVLLDLGEFRGFDYYDGVIFDVFAEGLGCELGGGGRYNHLIGKFGRDLPSTGFAFDLDRLFRAIERHADRQFFILSEVLVLGRPRDAAKMFEVARMLRQAGLRVIQDTVSDSGKTGRRAAVSKGRLLGTKATILIEESDEALVWLHAATKSSVGKLAAPLQKWIKTKDAVRFLSAALEEGK